MNATRGVDDNASPDGAYHAITLRHRATGAKMSIDVIAHLCNSGMLLS